MELSRAGDEAGRSSNAVRLTGRVSGAPSERELPSGDRLVTFRLVVTRERTPMTVKSKQTTDWVDCAAWGARARRSAASWQAGDQVEVEGALRRRFFRAGGDASTRLEVEMTGGRLLARADR